MHHKTSAIHKKMGEIKDFFTGTTRVDNRNNPASAASMMRRKMESRGPGKRSGLRPQ
jgi:L-lactate utilization protein LutB